MAANGVMATIGNGSMSKVFKADNDDLAWKNVPSEDSSTNLGILMPNATINHVQATYTEGCGVWRIQNQQTLAVSRRGLAAAKGYSCYESDSIQAHRLAPDEIIQFYTMAADGADTNLLAWVTTTKGTELYTVVAAVDDTLTEMKTAITNSTFGDAAFNSTLRSIQVTCQDGSQVEHVEIIDSAGGKVLTLQGQPRPIGAGGKSNYYNLDVSGLNLPVNKGFAMKIKCSQ